MWFLIAMIMAMINVVSMAPIVMLTLFHHGPEQEVERNQYGSCAGCKDQ
jgi:hypothetical protein